jgi:hypothetical protein
VYAQSDPPQPAWSSNPSPEGTGTGSTSSTPPACRVRISPHTFRRTTALHLLQSGVELNVVRSWLGHASIETTHAYIEIDLQMKRAALEACQPPELDSPPPSWKEPDLLTWLEAL